jgi:hypothetical protein
MSDARGAHEPTSHPPFFIGGLDRVGKTLLRSLLVAHPDISVPAVGSNMWTLFFGRFGSLADRDNLERCLSEMLRYRHVAFLQPDVARIRRELAAGPATYARLFALFQAHHAEREGKPRWGDQTGLVEAYADEIYAAYPGVRMIHMLRDPRDRYEASLALWPKGKGRVGGATARWLYSVGLAERNVRRYPDRYLVVRYESLVLEPEPTLRRISEFLAIDYRPGMLTMEAAPTYLEKSRQLGAVPAEGPPISTAFVGRFRDAVSPRELAFMQLFLGRRMSEHGYPPEPLGLSVLDRAQFLVRDAPANAARMTAWRVQQELQRRYPERFGRRPPRDKIR